MAPLTPGRAYRGRPPGGEPTTSAPLVGDYNSLAAKAVAPDPPGRLKWGAHCNGHEFNGMNRANATRNHNGGATIRRVVRRTMMALAMAALASGCFYPPTQKPPAPRARTKSRSTHPTTWSGTPCTSHQREQAAHQCRRPQPGHHRDRDQPLHARRRRLRQAQGSQRRQYAAEPDRAATAVYYFKVKPKGHEASIVSVQATFSAPALRSAPYAARRAMRLARQGRGAPAGTNAREAATIRAASVRKPANSAHERQKARHRAPPCPPSWLPREPIGLSAPVVVSFAVCRSILGIRRAPISTA